MDINEISKEINRNAHDKGFWEPNYNISEKLMLVVSELSEAQEADRKDKYCKIDVRLLNKSITEDEFLESFLINVKDTFQDEIADAVIRLLDLSNQMGFNLEQHIEAKMRYNYTRPVKHGKKH